MRVFHDDGAFYRAGSWRVTRPGTRLVPLLLFNNRDPEVYDWRSDKRTLTVRRVADAEGREPPFSHRFHEIVVEVRESMGPRRTSS